MKTRIARAVDPRTEDDQGGLTDGKLGQPTLRSSCRARCEPVCRILPQGLQSKSSFAPVACLALQCMAGTGMSSGPLAD
jgi:hypothetical protein